MEYKIMKLCNALAEMDRVEAWLRGATPSPRSGVVTESARLPRYRHGGEELPHVLNQGRWPRGAMPRPRSGEAAERNNPTSKVSFHSNPKEKQCQRMLKLLHNCTHLTR